jgi:hypothetical protein
MKTYNEDPFQPPSNNNDYILMIQLLLMSCDISMPPVGPKGFWKRTGARGIKKGRRDYLYHL